MAPRLRKSRSDILLEKKKGIWFLFGFVRAFLHQPTLIRAAAVAVPWSVMAGGAKYVDLTWPELGFLSTWVPEDNVIQSYTVILGFFAVFHTSHAYERLTKGAEMLYRVMGDLLDTTSVLFAFTRASQEGEEKINAFMEQVVRLVSLLFDVSIAELDDTEAHLANKVIDLQGIGEGALENILDSEYKKQVLTHMLQCLVVDNIAAGVLTIPPPLLATAFQQLGRATTDLAEVRSYKEVPFPFPFIAVTGFLLAVYCLVTPFFMAVWTPGIVSASLYTFVAVVTLLMLHGVAVELDNPFGTDVNDLDLANMQEELNQRLLTLLDQATAEGHRRSGVEWDGKSSAETNQEDYNITGLSNRYRARRSSATMSMVASSSLRGTRQSPPRRTGGESLEYSSSDGQELGFRPSGSSEAGTYHVTWDLKEPTPPLVTGPGCCGQRSSADSISSAISSELGAPLSGVQVRQGEESASPRRAERAGLLEVAGSHDPEAGRPRRNSLLAKTLRGSGASAASGSRWAQKEEDELPGHAQVSDVRPSLSSSTAREGSGFAGSGAAQVRIDARPPPATLGAQLKEEAGQRLPQRPEGDAGVSI